MIEHHFSLYLDNNVVRNIDSIIDSAGWGEKKSRYTEVFDYAIVNDNLCSKPDISIIIISWKQNENLERALRAARGQKKISKEIVFVNNGAEKSLRWCKSHANVYIELKENTGAYLARNIGAIFSRSEVLLFIDDDGISEERLALSHYKVHKNIPQIVSTRGVCLPISPNKLNNVPNHYYLGDKMLNAVPNLEGNSAFKKLPFIAIGGWDDNLLFGHGGLEITSRLLTIDDSIKNFAYIPHAILFHDFVKDKLHSDEKRKKQERAMSYLKGKNPKIESIKKSFTEEREIITPPPFISRDIRATERDFKKELRQLKKIRKNTFGCESITKISLLKKLSKSYEIYALGAGSLGERFARLCIKRNLKITCFFDRSPKRKIENFPIEHLQQPKKHGILIITTSQKESALLEVESKGLKFKKIFIFR